MSGKTRIRPRGAASRPPRLSPADDLSSEVGAPLRVEECRLLFVGGLRNVFQHPARENLVIKTMRPDRLDGNGELLSRKNRRVTRLRQLGPYATFAREIRATVRYFRHNFPLIGTPPPFNRVYGLIETTQGMGLIVEKITSADGSLPPTLRDMVMEGRFSAKHRLQLDSFFELAAEQHVNFGDLHAGNLVYEDKGEGRFVCIDGFGEKSFIPIYEWSRTANRYRLRQLQRRLMAGIERIRVGAERERHGAIHA